MWNCFLRENLEICINDKNFDILRYNFRNETIWKADVVTPHNLYIQGATGEKIKFSDKKSK